MFSMETEKLKFFTPIPRKHVEREKFVVGLRRGFVSWPVERFSWEFKRSSARLKPKSCIILQLDYTDENDQPRQTTSPIRPPDFWRNQPDRPIRPKILVAWSGQPIQATSTDSGPLPSVRHKWRTWVVRMAMSEGSNGGSILGGMPTGLLAANLPLAVAYCTSRMGMAPLLACVLN